MPHPGQLHLVAATCIIFKEQKVLIIKRADHEQVYPGKWTVPGGKLDRSDYESQPKTTADAWYGVIDAALRREVREETGLEITTPRYLLDLVFIHPNGTPVLTFSYWAEWQSGEVIIPDDFTDSAWISPAETDQYDIVPGIAEEIKEAAKVRGV